MKTYSSCLSIILLFALLSCQKDPSERITSRDPITIDSNYIPAVTELRYAHHGTYQFGFGDSGYYRFTADTFGNEFKVTATNYFYQGASLYDSIRYVYRYDTMYNLVSIEKKDLGFGGAAVYLELSYNTNNDLIKIEETSGNTVLETYSISRSVVNGNKKVSIDPYLATTPDLTDTMTHSLFYNAQGKLIQATERIGRKGPWFKEAIYSNFAYTYDGDDVVVIDGYSNHDSLPPSQPHQDSIRITRMFVRNTAEEPVLYSLMEKLYGKEFYHFISTFSLPFQNNHFGVFDPVLLPGLQQRSYETAYYASMLYVNGVQSDFSSAHHMMEVQLDAENRLVKSKHTTDLGPNYYTWQVVYRD
jgi:hypothetical protein